MLKQPKVRLYVLSFNKFIFIRSTIYEIFILFYLNPTFTGKKQKLYCGIAWKGNILGFWNLFWEVLTLKLLKHYVQRKRSIISFNIKYINIETFAFVVTYNFVYALDFILFKGA